MKNTDEADANRLLAQIAVDRWMPADERALVGRSAAAGRERDPAALAGTHQRPGILFCGGFHSSMRGNKAGHLHALSIEHGWPFTRFDYRGHGESPGAAEDFTLHDWLDDTLAVLRSLHMPVIIVGSSMGAWLAVLAALEEPSRVHGLLTLAAAPDFTGELLWPGLSDAHRARLLAGETVTLPSRYADASNPGGWPLRRELFDSGQQLSLLAGSPPDGLTACNGSPGDPPGDRRSRYEVGALRCPLRMVHGTADTDVPMRQSQRLFDAAGSTDASLLSLKGADHRLSDAASLEQIGRTLSELMQTVASQPVHRTPASGTG